MELEIVKQIKASSLDEVIKKYNLKMNRHSEYNNLVLLIYDQLKTPKNKATNECRSLILDENNNYAVVAYPFYRFNDYESNTKNIINWDNCKYSKKIDGSIITLYHYNNKWNVATKSLPDSRGVVNDINESFNQAFFRVFDKLGYELPQETNLNFIFEFTLPLDAYIAKEEENIILIGCRDLNTLKEIDIESRDFYNWKKVSFIRKPLEEILKEVEIMNPTEQEGYVVVDNNFNRLKIKSPQYDSIQALSSKEDNVKKFINIIRFGGNKEFLEKPKYKQYKEIFEKLLLKYTEVRNDFIEYDKKLDNLKLDGSLHIHINSDPVHLKEYGFYCINNKRSVDEYLRKIKTDKIAKWLSMK